MSIKPGYYKARGIAGSAQFGYAKNGSEQISVGLQLENGERMTTILSFSGGAVPISIDRLKALGWDGVSEELAGIDKLDAEVQVKEDEFHDEQTGELKKGLKAEIKTGGGGRFAFKKPMEEREKRGFMSDLVKKAKEHEAAKASGGSGAEFPHGANASKGAPSAGGPPVNQNLKI